MDIKILSYIPPYMYVAIYYFFQIQVEDTIYQEIGKANWIFGFSKFLYFTFSIANNILLEYEYRNSRVTVLMT